MKLLLLLSLVTLPLVAARASVSTDAAEPPAADRAAEERLQRYLDTLTSFEARFEQVIFGANADGEVSSGRFYLLRPGRLRWDYQRPHTQVIVADGEKLWVYDAELEQVVVRSIDAALAASTPAMLLAGRETVSEGYKVTAGQTRSGLDWVRMAPRRGDTDFLSIELGFAGEELQAMELRDKLGQTTRIAFSRVKRNARVDEKLFQFKPPPGADVIGSP